MTLAAGLLVIVVAIVAIAKRVDVRIAMFGAAICLGAIVQRTDVIVRTFLDTFTSDQFVVPICTAMGFAYVLRHSGCDRHLVRLLATPLRYVRWLLIPGAVVVGFVVNISVISQASTAVAVGTVLIPLLRAGGLSPTTVGASLLLGTSLGGELLNPGAPELRTVSERLGVDARDVVGALGPLLAIQLVVATLVFWVLSLRHEQGAAAPVPTTDDEPINYVKAVVPLLPLALLMVIGPPFNLVEVPQYWLVSDANARSFGNRLIGAAMLIGVTAAVMAAPRSAPVAAKEFFAGAGHAFTTIVSLIVTAQCFAKGVELIGLAKVIGDVVASHPALLWLCASALSYGFAILCGSGMATTQGLFGFFATASDSTPLLLDVGAVVAIASAAGRTSSPVAAVVLMCAQLTDSRPLVIARRVAVPLLVALAVTTIATALSH
ncbi:MAG: C4-dicarboxylate transporter DcuC [Gemmataceae bacterium]